MNMRYKNITILIWNFLIISTFSNCSGNADDTLVKEPAARDAAFTYDYDIDNPNRVLFKAANEGVNAWYSHWLFGDNTSGEGTEVSKTYPLKGQYVVRHKIFTEGGTAEYYDSVRIEADLLGADLVENGELNGEDAWELLPIADGVEITFENGQASWTGGGWGHAGIYQAIAVEAGTLYQINMEIKGEGMTDCWFEVYVGKASPVAYQDYTDGGIRLGLNTWEGCGGEPFDGLFSTLSCSGGDGTFEFPDAGLVYLVIRSGGVDLGTNGVRIDNISVRPF